MRREPTKVAMRSGVVSLGIALLALLPWVISANAADKTTPKQAKLDPGTIEMLSNILESLDTFRNDRLKDLEKIRQATPPANGTSVERTGSAPKNISISEQIKALKEGIMGHNPVKKTFGYKVTVYTSPIGKDGKDENPVLVTQYVGGDMMPDPPSKRNDDMEDLQESANHPEKQIVRSSESAHLPVHVSISNLAGGGEGHHSAAEKAATDHARKTEHQASSEKGHQNSHSLHQKSAKGHDHERHSAKHDEHHKETEKESHRHDTQAHDKGGASQQGIRERTEIEYYEREHFLDTEYDKAKTGHDKTSGVKEHEKHQDHDSHENKRLHAKEESDRHKTDTGVSLGKAGAHVVKDQQHIYPPHYDPSYDLPYPAHVAVEEHKLEDGSHALKEDDQKSKLHHSEESKGQREHNHEKDTLSEQQDKGYVDKDKGRRKEGYRERGYKITAEREYFLNDAHHDKGVSTHTSGSRLKDEEGAAKSSKEGERDRGFTKEEKTEEAHDAAYDAKDQKYFDGEEHSEDFSAKKSASASSGEQKHKDEIIPLGPPGVNYVDHHPPVPIYPLPIAYAPSNDGAQAVVAYPPDDLDLKKNHHGNSQRAESVGSRPTRNGRTPENKHWKPVGGYDDDDYEDETKHGYRGHAGYRKRENSPLISSIRDSVRKDVHAKPPSYSKSESKPAKGKSVQYLDDASEDGNYDSESDSDEETDEELYSSDDRKPDIDYDRDFKEEIVESNYHKPKEGKLIKLREEYPSVSSKEKLYPEVPKRKRYQHENVYNNAYPTENFKQPQRPVQNQPHVYHQNQDKLLRTADRNAYPQIQSGKLPTVREILAEVSRFPSSKASQGYKDASQQARPGNNNHIIFPDAQNYQQNSPESFGQRQLRKEQEQYHQQQIRTPQGQNQQTSHVVNPLLQLQQQQRAPNPLEQLQRQRPIPQSTLEQLQKHLEKQLQQQSRTLSPLEQLQNLQQQQHALQQKQNQHRSVTPAVQLQLQQQLQREVTPFEQLQKQQTQPPFSPVVLLTRGPPRQNQAVDVWYTRQNN